MSRTCDICGKGIVTGNKVSHAKNRTRRVWKPNLHTVKTEIGGTTLTLKLCARCIKSGYVARKVRGVKKTAPSMQPAQSVG